MPGGQKGTGARLQDAALLRLSPLLSINTLDSMFYGLTPPVSSELPERPSQGHGRSALQESVAVTQNFVSSVGLRQCLAFLKTGNPDLVSGCLQHQRTNLHQRFLAALREHRPKVPPLLLSPYRISAIGVLGSSSCQPTLGE